MKTQNSNWRNGGCLWKLVKLAILSAIVLGVAVYFAAGYILDYVLKTATAGTGIDIGISSVSMSVSEQKVEVNNFRISNPPNFKKCNAIEFKEAVLDADVSISDVLSKKLIVLDEIRVIGLNMNIDMKVNLASAPTSNITEIKNALAAKYGAGQKSSAAQTAQTTQPSGKAQGEASEPWRIIVKKMVFADGVIDGSLNSQSMKVAMPSFTLENIGAQEGGLTPGEFVLAVVTKLSSVATTSMAGATVDGGSDGAQKAIDSAKNALQKLFK
ncbi:MAG: hypothetical protein IJI37_01055 [Opitutales bacterium]|nr:hypothetical protein [Opitutales bacterium]